MPPAPPHVTIRRAVREDAPALIRAHRASRAFHAPYAEPFIDQAGFDAWFAQLGARKLSMVAEADGEIVGVVNLSEIVMGALCGAYLGYYAMEGAGGRGLMTEAVRQAVAFGFHEIGLHRIEANIQPANEPSRALVRRLGFRLEGFSPRYLRIAGEWRDHERWAKLADE